MTEGKQVKKAELKGYISDLEIDLERVTEQRNVLRAELAEAKLNTEAVAQARDEAIGRVEKMAESYRELAEEYDALKAAKLAGEASEGEACAICGDVACPEPFTFTFGKDRVDESPVPHTEALMDPDRPIPHAEYVEGYRKWAQERSERVARLAGYAEGYRKRERGRIALEMARHTHKFAKPREELWADMPWSPIKDRR